MYYTVHSFSYLSCLFSCTQHKQKITAVWTFIGQFPWHKSHTALCSIHHPCHCHPSLSQIHKLNMYLAKKFYNKKLKVLQTILWQFFFFKIFTTVFFVYFQQDLQDSCDASSEESEADALDKQPLDLRSCLGTYSTPNRSRLDHSGLCMTSSLNRHSLNRPSTLNSPLSVSLFRPS